jgi:thiol-disulfide isomerase/thioredoxin
MTERPVTKKLVGIVGAVLVVAGFAILALVARAAWATAPGSPINFAEPRPVPEVSIESIDGETLSSADWRGKVTIVNFWGSWCAPCAIETPAFVALQEKYRDEVQFIGLAIDDTLEAVQAFRERYSVNYPLALAEYEMEDAFGGVIGYPTTFVVDTKGQIVQTHIGLISASIYENEIRALAGLEPLPEPEPGG